MIDPDDVDPDEDSEPEGDEGDDSAEPEPPLLPPIVALADGDELADAGPIILYPVTQPKTA